MRQADRCTDRHIAHFISQSHSITLSEIPSLSLLCSDGRGYYGNGVVLWPWMYTHTLIHTQTDIRSFSRRPFMHTYLELQVPPKYHPSWFWLTRSRGGGSQLVMRLISHNALQPLGTHCARSQAINIHEPSDEYVNSKSDSVQVNNQRAHQSEMRALDVQGWQTGISWHQRELVMIMNAINAYNHKDWDLD